MAQFFENKGQLLYIEINAKRQRILYDTFSYLQIKC